MNKMKLTYVFLTLVLWSLVSNVKAQEQPIKVELSNKESFSMILLPDPQSYVKFDTNQPIFDLMTAWVANNVNALNMKSVICTGDLVEQNEWPVPDGINGNQTGTEQWQSASKAFERLDGKIPYILCTGNHDYGYQKAENRLTQFPEYFPAERNSSNRGVLVNVGYNWQNRATLENAAYEFKTETWGDILVISLEFAPRDEAIEWARNLSESSKYKHHKVILLTHSYMEYDGTIFEKENYKVSPANYGKTIWEKLIKPSSNICMLICGHAGDVGNFDKQVGYRVDENAAGKKIPQMMFNAQTAGGGWHGNGGDGWLRILEFLPDGKTIQVRTFSPFFAISPTTAQYAWRTESFDQFELAIE